MGGGDLNAKAFVDGSQRFYGKLYMITLSFVVIMANIILLLSASNRGHFERILKKCNLLIEILLFSFLALVALP